MNRQVILFCCGCFLLLAAFAGCSRRPAEDAGLPESPTADPSETEPSTEGAPAIARPEPEPVVAPSSVSGLLGSTKCCRNYETRYYHYNLEGGVKDFTRDMDHLVKETIAYTMAALLKL